MTPSEVEGPGLEAAPFRAILESRGPGPADRRRLRAPWPEAEPRFAPALAHAGWFPVRLRAPGFPALVQIHPRPAGLDPGGRGDVAAAVLQDRPRRSRGLPGARRRHSEGLRLQPPEGALRPAAGRGDPCRHVRPDACPRGTRRRGGDRAADVADRDRALGRPNANLLFVAGGAATCCRRANWRCRWPWQWLGGLPADPRPPNWRKSAAPGPPTAPPPTTCSGAPTCKGRSGKRVA